MRKIILLIMVMILAASTVFAAPVKVIGVTNNLYSGALGGAAGADAKCMTWAASQGYLGTWKALIGTPTGRFAGGPDWVLTATTSYYRTDTTTLIEVTHGGACFDFSPNLVNSIDGTSSTIWTGLTPACSLTNHCLNWATTAFPPNTGGTGDSGVITSDALYAPPVACNMPAKLYCVGELEQLGGEEPEPIPEFSTMGIIFALILGITGILLIIKNKK